jgi:competence protein ComEC
MIKTCLVLLAGIYALQLSSFAVYFDPIAVISAAACLLLALSRLRYLGWFVAGAWLYASAVQTVVESRIDAQFVGDSIVTRIRITDFPRDRQQSVSFTAQPLDDPRLPRRLRLSWFEPPVRLYSDDTWQVELRLRRPRSSSNPGGTDFEGWLTRERIGAVGYVVSGKRNHLLLRPKSDLVRRLRQRFVDRVDALLGDTEPAAVLVAVAVGSRHLLTAEQWDRYARSGTSHLMAISGLHIGLAALGGYLLCRGLCAMTGWRGNQHQFAIAVGMVVATCYALISGLAVPSRRAGLMIILAGLALQRRRLPGAVRLMCAAAMFIAMASPLATMAPGFKLSFAAVTVLLWLAQHRDRGVVAPAWSLPRMLKRLRQFTTAQAFLFFGLLPMSALIFDRIVFTAPPVNLVAVPVFSLITVPLALAGLLLDGPLRPLGDLALSIAAASIAGIEQVIAWSVSASWATRPVPALAGVAWLYVFMPLLWVVVPPGWPGRQLAWVGVTALVMHSPARPEDGCAMVEVLDVGQGLAAVVETRSSTLLFDTGPSFRGGGSSAATTVLPFLASRGIRRLDTLVVSHADLDHAGGVPPILEALDVGQVDYGEPIATGDTTSRQCVSGEQWEHDHVRFRYLHPSAAASTTGNDASCVLEIKAGQWRLLLTGDIERSAEAALLRSQAIDPVDVVVVPHHGSTTSSSPAFVNALRPRFAIVSAGYGNRWGFPKQDIVKRWEGAGAEVLDTATSGAVHLRLCAGEKSIAIQRHRQAQRRIWHE